MRELQLDRKCGASGVATCSQIESCVDVVYVSRREARDLETGAYGAGVNAWVIECAEQLSGRPPCSD